VKKILIIDDSFSVRNFMRKSLELYGFEVIEAENGNEGCRLFYQKKPDIVITDIFMPEKEGIETIIDLRKSSPDICIIAMSDGGKYGQNYFNNLTKVLGVKTFLKKPFSSKELINTINQFLD
jgi:YesN/AraC family two-component response regulator